MAEWYRNSNGWEEGYEFIDLGYDGDFIAYRRQISDGRIIYEGDFWDATTETKVAAYLDVLVDWNGRWIHTEIIPIEEEAEKQK